MPPDTNRRSIAARDALILANVRLVGHLYKRLAARYHSVRKLSMDEACQVGYLSLIRAAELWDDKFGVGFGAYAGRGIVRAIKDAADRNTHVHIHRSANGENDWDMHSRLSLRARSLVTIDAMPYQEQPREDDTQLADAIAGEERRTLWRAMWQLPRKERELLRLIFFEGLTMMEISRTRSRCRENIRQIKQRALRRLKCILTGREYVSPKSKKGRAMA